MSGEYENNPEDRMMVFLRGKHYDVFVAGEKSIIQRINMSIVCMEFSLELNKPLRYSIKARIEPQFIPGKRMDDFDNDGMYQEMLEQLTHQLADRINRPNFFVLGLTFSRKVYDNKPKWFPSGG